MARPTSPRRPSRWKRVVAGAAIGVVGLAAIGWLAAPTVVSSRVQGAARRAGLDVEIERLGLLRSLSQPVELSGLVVATSDAPSSPALSLDRAALAWASRDTPRADPFSRLPPRLVIEGLRLDLVRDRTGAGNYRPTRPARDTKEKKSDDHDEKSESSTDSPRPNPTPKVDPPADEEAASGGAGTTPVAGERAVPWLTHVIVRGARVSMHHDSPDSKTRGGGEVGWDEFELRRQAPRTGPDGRVVERLEVAINNLSLDGPLGWGETREMLRAPSVVAALEVPLPFENEDDDTVPLPRLTRLDIQGGHLRRARDHKGRWQETHLQRIVKSIRDKKPPGSDEDRERDEPEEVSSGLASPGVQNTSTSASNAPPAAAAKEETDERSRGFVIEQATARDFALTVEALTPVGLEAVTYTLDTADWRGADAGEETVLPRTLTLEGHAGEAGTFELDWSRRVDAATGDVQAVTLSLHTRALPFHPLVWGAWKHDQPELGEVRRALVDADYELAWDRAAGQLTTRGTFQFRDVVVLPDTRPTWQRLMQPAPSAWPSILNDLTHGGTTEAEPIVFDERRTMAEFDAFLAWQVAQDIFIAARLAAAERARTTTAVQP